MVSTLPSGLTGGDRDVEDSHSMESSSVNDSSNNDSSTGLESGHQQGDDETVSYSLAKSETRRVLRSKILLLIVITLCAVGCSTAAFYIARGAQEHEFANQFNDYADEIVALSDVSTRNIVQATELVSTTLTSFAMDTGASWPNVTLPNFEVQGFKSNKITQGIQMTISPLVSSSQREGWEVYASQEQGWIDESIDEAINMGIEQIEEDYSSYVRANIPMNIYGYGQSTIGEVESPFTFGKASWSPVWQQSPVSHNTSIVNFNLFSHPVFERLYHGVWETGRGVLSEVLDLSFLYSSAIIDSTDHPHSFLMYPVFPDFANYENGDDMVALITLILNWDFIFANILHDGVDGIIAVLRGSCGDSFSYRLDGPNVTFLGYEDMHDPAFDNYVVEADFAPILTQHQGYSSDSKEHCVYVLKVYPSVDLKSSYTTSEPILLSIAVVLIFVFTAVMFLVYDYFVQRRQDKVMRTAKRTNAVVASLFPENVRDRILKDAEEQANKDMKRPGKDYFRKESGQTKMQLKSFLDEEEAEKEIGNVYGSKPIADLFPEATVLFADIAGFTAWSSVREPCQVFTLLETVYHAFDEIAKRRRVFKVETIGDCYVAVVGLPEPRKDHAVCMCRFARDCLYSMNNLVKKLERTLGPDTADLSMRMGLHSGPVTAGVLRGDKSRFQLFGDTVNTAARIESSGTANKIHLSQETAELLIAAGKTHWVVARQDIVNAKGKGELSTYWLEFKGQSGESTRSGSTEQSGDDGEAVSTSPEEVMKPKSKVSNDLDSRTLSLVSWNTDVLAKLLKQIIARRQVTGQKVASIIPVADPANKEKNVIEEVAEVIQLPAFDAKLAKSDVDPETIDLDPFVYEQIEDLVTQFAMSYNSNPFHNFEHASHVTMSVTKLLSRIVAPDISSSDEATLHDHTYGITSDVMTQFGCIFAALIHDVEHQGVTNAQLVKEDNPLAIKYNGQSVAEQNSVDKAWDMFMSSDYAEFRALLCPTEVEMKRFRQLVVNAVMATDIVDKELKNARNARWEKAFSESDKECSPIDVNNRKATIVIEHLIQASDVAHTMQHWFVFRKWNERLYHEMYKAYKEGRSSTDPSEFWYKGEIGFFDFYVIPLAKKLAHCGVFGVSSDEYLNYAIKNRKEWEHRGQEVVAEMVTKYEAMYASADARKIE